jgi:hypothetical protein
MEVLEQELKGRVWRSTTFGTAMVALTELAYTFIDYRVHGTFQLPTLRVLHVLWALAMLGVLLARRQVLTRTASTRSSSRRWRPSCPSSPWRSTPWPSPAAPGSR